MRSSIRIILQQCVMSTKAASLEFHWNFFARWAFGRANSVEFNVLFPFQWSRICGGSMCDNEGMEQHGAIGLFFWPVTPQNVETKRDPRIMARLTRWKLANACMHVMYKVVQDYACKSCQSALCITHSPLHYGCWIQLKKVGKKKNKGRIGQVVLKKKGFNQMWTWWCCKFGHWITSHRELQKSITY